MVDKTFTADAILIQDGRIRTFTADAVLQLDGEITLGSLVLVVDFGGIEPRYHKITAKHSILGATNSKRQNMGRDSTEYEVTGIMEGADRNADMTTMRNYYLNHTEVIFQGYVDPGINVRVIDLAERDMYTYWEWKIVIEVTGT